MAQSTHHPHFSAIESRHDSRIAKGSQSSLDTEEFPIVAPLLRPSRLKLDETESHPIHTMRGLSWVFWPPICSSVHTLRQGKECATSDLKEMPLLRSEPRKRLKRVPVRARSFVKDLLNIVIEGSMTGSYFRP